MAANDYEYWMSKIGGLTEVMVKPHVKSLSALPDQNHDKI
jgi:hypothetical protein